MKLEHTDCFPKPWHPNYPESRNQTEEPESQCAHLSLKELRLLTCKKGKGDNHPGKFKIRPMLPRINLRRHHAKTNAANRARPPALRLIAASATKLPDYGPGRNDRR